MKLALAAAVLLLTGSSAFAGDYALLSMSYSADQFVPHIRYDGVITPGDAEGLAALFDRTLGCEQTCIGSSAVLTLNSVGGNFVEAQAIAKVLRARHIATVVEADQSCYGACIIAFTGGSAFTSGGGVVADRTVVPGARIGMSNFNEPHEGLGAAIIARGIDTVLGGTPIELEALANSGQWGVSTLVTPFLNGMMTSGLDLATAEGLHLMQARLPSIARKDIEPDQASAVLNACSYLIARHERQTPGDMIEQPDPGFIENFPPEARGDTLMGYTVGGREDFNFCGMPIDSTSVETISLYHQGDEGIREVHQAKVELAMLLVPFTSLSDLQAVAKTAIDAAQFRSSGLIYLTQYNESLEGNPFGVKTLYQDKYHRISSVGDLTIYEQGGGTGLFDAAAAFMVSSAVTRASLSQMGGITILRASYADSGNGVDIMAFEGRTAGSNDAVARIELGKPWNQLTPEELSFIPQFECALMIGNLNLECE